MGDETDDTRRAAPRGCGNPETRVQPVRGTLDKRSEVKNKWPGLEDDGCSRNGSWEGAFLSVTREGEESATTPTNRAP